MQEKAVILLSSPYIPASAPDTALFIQTLNTGSVDALAPRLSADVAMLSEDGARTIRGSGLVLGHFTARLDDLQQGDTVDYLAVAGMLHETEDGDAANGDPCAIFYDGFRKSCVFQLGLGDGDYVERIVLSAQDSTLRRAWPIEPPVFRDGAILPSLDGQPAQR